MGKNFSYRNLRCKHHFQKSLINTLVHLPLFNGFLFVLTHAFEYHNLKKQFFEYFLKRTKALIKEYTVLNMCESERQEGKRRTDLNVFI